MRITLLTMGTRGDTQPFISLALRLMRAGHIVKLGARPDFADLAEEYGIDTNGRSNASWRGRNDGCRTS